MTWITPLKLRGVIKPGANLMKIIKTAKEVTNLTTKDVVVWGGRKDVGKKETTNGLRQLMGFVRENSHTNIIQMYVPHTFDLHVNSYVNREVEVFNRK
jgi:hypothetical protein